MRSFYTSFGSWVCAQCISSINKANLLSLSSFVPGGAIKLIALLSKKFNYLLFNEHECAEIPLIITRKKNPDIFYYFTRITYAHLLSNIVIPIIVKSIWFIPSTLAMSTASWINESFYLINNWSFAKSAVLKWVITLLMEAVATLDFRYSPLTWTHIQ